MDNIEFLYASDGTGEAVRAVVTGTRIISSTTLEVDSVNNFPDSFVATVGTLNISTGIIDNSTVTIFKGHLDAGDIIIDEIAPGYADNGNSIGQVVVLKPNTFWADTLANVLSVAHNNDGSLKNNAVTTNVIADDAVTAPKLVGIDKSNLTTDSNPYKFSVYKSANQTGLTDNTFNKVTWDSERYDTNNNFASSTYTAPVAGFYHIGAYLQFQFSGGTTGISSIASIYINGVEARRADGNSTNTGINSLMMNQVSDIFQLNATDTVDIYAYADVSSGTFSVIGGSLASRFFGFLVSRT